VIGRNYLSFIISLLLANKDQTLLMIDDERVRYGENWHRNIGEFEKNTLQSIGEAFEVEPLKNINKYLSPSPFYLKLGNRHVKLGDTPFENLREIARKIPECFTKKVHSIFNES